MRLSFAACFFVSVGIAGGIFSPSATAQDATGEWHLAKSKNCPLTNLRILKNGEAVVWTLDYHRSYSRPQSTPHLNAKFKRRGNKIEMAMTSEGLDTFEYSYPKLTKWNDEEKRFVEVDQVVHASLRGTISGDRIKAAATISEGKNKGSGTCEFMRSVNAG